METAHCLCLDWALCAIIDFVMFETKFFFTLRAFYCVALQDWIITGEKTHCFLNYGFPSFGLTIEIF